MKIIRASHLGFCFGVRDAIALASAKAENGPLTIFGELVHNPQVIEDLAAKGAHVVKEVAELKGGEVMVTAHGASEKTLQRLRSTGLQISEATCPLVKFAHKSLAQLCRAGYHPVVIGKRGHVEVNGLTEDLESCDIVLSDLDVDRVQPRPRYGVIAQTTQPIERVTHLVRLLQEKFPDAEIKFVDTVCQPTKQRQQAAEELALKSDVVVVIGGAHSNNTRELAATCRKYCERVYHIESPSALVESWFAQGMTVGITAGTSTPDSVIAEVEEKLQKIGQGLERAEEQLLETAAVPASSHATQADLALV